MRLNGVWPPVGTILGQQLADLVAVVGPDGSYGITQRPGAYVVVVEHDAEGVTVRRASNADISEAGRRLLTTLNPQSAAEASVVNNAGPLTAALEARRRRDLGI